MESFSWNKVYMADFSILSDLPAVLQSEGYDGPNPMEFDPNHGFLMRFYFLEN